MMLYLFLLLKSFKLETRFINIQQDTLTDTCRTNIKKFSILFQGPRIWNSLPNDIKNAPSFSIFKRVIKPGSGRMQPKYLNTLYLYFPLNTLIYLNKRLFSLFLKIKLPVGGNLYSS